jgi:hypothetical protein
MRITSDGIIQISTTASIPTTNNSIYSYSGNGYLYIQGGSTGLGLSAAGSRNNIIYVNETSNFIRFDVNSAERMRITSGGLVAIGTTSALINESSLAVTSGGNTATFKTTLNGGNALLCWNSITNGNPGFISFGTEGSYTERGYIYYDRGAGQVKLSATSDARLKKDILNAPDALPILDKIKVRQYKWKETGNENIGFIAQELYEVVERAVSIGEDYSDGSIKRAWGVNNDMLVPYLVKAVQELKAELDTLKNK